MHTLLCDYQLIYFLLVLVLPLILGSYQHLLILLSSIVPAEVLLHASFLYALKGVTELSVGIERIAYGISEVACVCPIKCPACASVLIWVVRLDSVSQATNLQPVSKMMTDQCPGFMHLQGCDARQAVPQTCDIKAGELTFLTPQATSHTLWSCCEVEVRKGQEGTRTDEACTWQGGCQAYRMHNWDGAVSHGIQLVETTWLKAGGHEQDVAACCDAMGHSHTETDPAPTLILPMLLHFSAT